MHTLRNFWRLARPFWTSEQKYPALLLLLATVAMNLYLYGDQAAVTVARETPLWEAWFQEHFPMPAEQSK